MQTPGIHIIALETSQNASGSVAALADHQLLQSITLSAEQRSAVSLAPAIDELLKKLDWKRTSDRITGVQLLSVVRGPGSFTGLRIGVTTAKMLSYAWQVPVVGVLGTDCLALQTAQQLGATSEQVQLQLDKEPIADSSLDKSCQKISVAIDAHRQQVFTADYFYDPRSMSLQLSKQTRLLDIDQWVASLEPSTHVCGPVLEKLLARLSLPSLNLNIAPQSVWIPQAATAGVIAWHYFRNGRHDDPFQLEPLYLRPSYAEEKRMAVE